MNQELSGLYQRICDYSPDDGESAFTFTQRLSRDNGWEWEYARRVAEEYKKFMFLAVTADHPVTPSEQIDQAWHLHLIYTRSYWDDFCGQVLGTPIHHGPTKGGSDEQAMFYDFYERTKASYERLLNESPPPDIWPDATRRFGDDIHCVRVNTQQHWIIPKRRAQRSALVALAALVFVAAAGYEFLGSGQVREFAGTLRGTPRASSDGRGVHVSGDRVIGSAIRTADVSSRGLIRSAVWNGPGNLIAQTNPGQSASQRPAQQNRNQSSAVVWGVAIGMIVVVSIAVAALFSGKCSACGRSHAMKKTGNSERGTGWFASTKDEWQCNHCGATMWTTHYAGCGGGSGCGTTHCGDSGCGGSGCGGGGCGGGGCGGGGCGGG